MMDGALTLEPAKALALTLSLALALAHMESNNFIDIGDKEIVKHLKNLINDLLVFGITSKPQILKIITSPS